ncbi:MAG: hypothetical protein FJW39_05245 [Acidobacteria bacterium]|nr:hypothetical protein [Acidobacteriota bacterium]
MASKKKAAVEAPAAAPQPQQNEPNLYELQGGNLTVSYSTSSISGKPLFNYKKGRTMLSFMGDQIRTQSTGIGTLVTVDIEFIPDLRTVTFTLVVPQVNLPPKNKARIVTIGITTASKTSIGGPGLVQGQVQSYKVAALKGTASMVFF